MNTPLFKINGYVFYPLSIPVIIIALLVVIFVVRKIMKALGNIIKAVTGRRRTDDTVYPEKEVKVVSLSKSPLKRMNHIPKSAISMSKNDDEDISAAEMARFKIINKWEKNTLPLIVQDIPEIKDNNINSEQILNAIRGNKTWEVQDFIVFNKMTIRVLSKAFTEAAIESYNSVTNMIKASYFLIAVDKLNGGFNTPINKENPEWFSPSAPLLLKPKVNSSGVKEDIVIDGVIVEPYINKLGGMAIKSLNYIENIIRKGDDLLASEENEDLKERISAITETYDIEEIQGYKQEVYDNATDVLGMDDDAIDAVIMGLLYFLYNSIEHNLFTDRETIMLNGNEIDALRSAVMFINQGEYYDVLTNPIVIPIE